ncbi:MAG TPA: hypothetical protein VFQ38_05745 [Longimicrobiales bacterium]|nr:hypothetical protein [Longimicrobiales bacterium]
MTSRPERDSEAGAWLRATRLAGLLVLVLAALAPSAARAQTPADSAAILLDAAGRLERAGRGESARALLAQIRDRFPGTAAAAEADRLLVTVRPGAPGAAPRAVAGESSGKTELIVWGTLYGLWLGAAVPAAVGADKPGPYGAGLILGGPAGYAASRTYAETFEVTEGQARAVTFGGTWGTWHGLALAYILDLGRDHCAGAPPGEPCFASNDPSGKAVFTSMILGGLAGIGIGGVIADGRPIAPGTATAVNFAALWGAAYGSGVAWLFGADDRHPVLTGALVGGDAALALAALTSPHWTLSRERARLISITGLAGLLVGVGADLLLQSDSKQVNVLIPMTTSLAGLAAGTSWTRAMDRGRGGGGGGGGAGALLEMDGRELHLAAPTPMPTLLRRDDRRGAEPGIYLPVLRARF